MQYYVLHLFPWYLQQLWGVILILQNQFSSGVKRGDFPLEFGEEELWISPQTIWGRLPSPYLPCFGGFTHISLQVVRQRGRIIVNIQDLYRHWHAGDLRGVICKKAQHTNRSEAVRYIDGLR